MRIAYTVGRAGWATFHLACGTQVVEARVSYVRDSLKERSSTIRSAHGGGRTGAPLSDVEQRAPGIFGWFQIACSRRVSAAAGGPIREVWGGSVVKRILLGLVLLSATSCSSGSSGPSSTSNAQIAGVWHGTSTRTSVTGGECLGAIYPVGGSVSVTMTVTQSGSSVSATLTPPPVFFNFTGSVTQSVVTMSGSTCLGCDLLSVQCPNSNGMRDVHIQTFAMNGAAAGNSLTGTLLATFNVFVAGTSTQVGTLSLADSLSLTRP
jgi:hypothetical protein